MNAVRRIGMPVACAALTFTLLAAFARAMPLTNIVLLVVAVLSPYGVIAGALAAVTFVIHRRTALSIIAVSAGVMSFAVQVPWHYFGQPEPSQPHVTIRVLSSNLLKGQADPFTFVATAVTSADVITVSELTSQAIKRFASAGISKTFKYSALIPTPGAGGIGVWSRYPIAELAPAKYEHLSVVSARLRIPGVQFNPMVVSVHITSPVASDTDAFNEWRTGIAAAKAELNRVAELTSPAAVIVGGDFNSTPDMRQFRDLASLGCRDAVEQTGAGFAPTFPSTTWHPPLITIDHILTCRAAATSIRTVYIRGSDHRALLATVDVPTT